MRDNEEEGACLVGVIVVRLLVSGSLEPWSPLGWP